MDLVRGRCAWSTHHHHPVQRSTGLPARRRRHLHLRSAAGMNPRCERHSPRRPSPRLSRTPVTGSDKGAEASAAMVRRLIVCCDGTWNTPNEGVRGDPCRPTSTRRRGDRGDRLGGTQQLCFYEGGLASTGGSDWGAERSASASTAPAEIARCGWPTWRLSADSSFKRRPSRRRLRMPPRRHETGWS